MSKTKNVKVTMYLEVDEDKVDDVCKITHHAEYFLDLDSWPEIKSVYGVKAQVLKG